MTALPGASSAFSPARHDPRRSARRYCLRRNRVVAYNACSYDNAASVRLCGGCGRPLDMGQLSMADGAVEATRHARIGSALVGRNVELGVLAASIESLCAGRGGVTVLFGEPGAGKSRLVAEARRCAEGRDVRWLEGRALSFGRGLSYWPFIDILKDCFSIADTDSEARGLDKLERALRQLFGQRADEIVPYVATVLALQPGSRTTSACAILDAQAPGRQVFLSLHQLFERLAQRQPLLLVMEDWHWVDQSSVALCEHLLPLTRPRAADVLVRHRAPSRPSRRHASRRPRAAAGLAAATNRLSRRWRQRTAAN